MTSPCGEIKTSVNWCESLVIAALLVRKEVLTKKKEIKSPRLKAQCNSGEGGESTAIPLQVLLPYSDLIAEDLLVATYALTQPQLSVCTAAAF